MLTKHSRDSQTLHEKIYNFVNSPNNFPFLLANITLVNLCVPQDGETYKRRLGATHVCQVLGYEKVIKWQSKRYPFWHNSTS